MHFCRACVRYKYIFALRVPHDYTCLLYSRQDIVTRHLNGPEDCLLPISPVAWAADSQSELTPSESLASSDAVRNTFLLPSMPFSHFSNLCTSPGVSHSLSFHPIILPSLLCYLLPLIGFISFSALSPFILPYVVSFSLSMLLFIL